ncbi:MAG: hypothetical protein AAF747_04290, partial [Planctomycetota bacterium]
STTDTSGDVTSLDHGSTANFDDGFPSRSALSSVLINISVAPFTAGVAPGAGSFEIVDLDGDVFSGEFTGLWTQFGPITFFSAEAGDATFDGTNGNGTFEGPDGGSFAFSDLPTLEGGFSLLLRVETAGFTQGFSGTSTQADGIFVPTPGAAAILALGGITSARRRR